jgi:ribosome-associated protein
MRGLVNFCDFFVLATGTSDRQVKAVAEGIEEGLSKVGVNAHLVREKKGFQPPDTSEAGGAWFLLDLGDVVVHLFEPNAREFYGLEHLWQDAPMTAYKECKRSKKASS